MSQRGTSLTAELRTELRHLAAELRELVRLRYELARLELADSASQIRRLAIAWVVALLLLLIGLPVLVVAAAELLDGWLLSRAGWLLVFGVLLIGTAFGLATLMWLRFRRGFVGLRDTLAELREDAVWIGEWTGAADLEDDTAGTGRGR